MSAVFNDCFGSFHRTLAAQIGDALLSYDNLDGVLAAVQMADQRNDGAYLPAFGRRGAGENGEKSVASKITRTADAVHHVSAHHMGAVHIAGNVHLDGGVDGEDTETADDFRTVGDLLWAEQKTGAEELQILVNVPQNRIAHAQRTPAGKADCVALDQRSACVLNHFSVHVEPWNFRMRAHCVEHRIGRIPHAGLYRKEARRDSPELKFRGEESGHIFSDARGRLRDGAE